MLRDRPRPTTPDHARPRPTTPTPDGAHDLRGLQVLLKWHPIVLKRAGMGSIVRTLSEVKEAL